MQKRHIFIALVVGMLALWASPSQAKPLHALPKNCVLTQHQTVKICTVKNVNVVSVADKGWVFDHFGNIVLDDTVSLQAGFWRNQNGSLEVAFDSGSTVGVLAPYNGTGAETRVNNSFIGVAGKDGNGAIQPLSTDTSGNANVNVVSGGFSGALPAGTNTIGGVFIVPSYQSGKTETLVLMDASGGTAGCAAAGAYPTINSTNRCQTIKAGPGLLYKITWVGAAAMTSTNILTCYDNLSAASGPVIFVGTFGAGGYMMAPVQGQSFPTGLTCSVNAAQASGQFLFEFK